MYRRTPSDQHIFSLKLLNKFLTGISISHIIAHPTGIKRYGKHKGHADKQITLHGYSISPFISK